MTIHADDLPALGELQRSTSPDDRAQAWEVIATLTEGDTCPGCGARLDPEQDTLDEPEDGSGWHYDVTAWFHTCAPGSPPLRAQ